jgi:transketolase
MIDIKNFANDIRRSCLNMVHNANASHIGSALSIADIIAVLYEDVLNVEPKNPEMLTRDRFILSKGHACVAVYSALAIKGFFPKIELTTFAENKSKMMSHISHKVSGVEFSTGSLGHGLPFAVGKALAAKKRESNWRTFALLSDGELGEGSNWEALMFAAHNKLDNLVVIIDYNKLQSLTSVKDTLGIEPLTDKAKAFGWSVRQVDGHNHNQLKNLLGSTPWESEKPSFLIANTIKGKGVSFMENKVEWHYKSPNTDQLKLALKELKD